MEICVSQARVNPLNCSKFYSKNNLLKEEISFEAHKKIMNKEDQKYF